MTRDDAMRRAQQAMGCSLERDEAGREWCVDGEHLFHCPAQWQSVTDLLLAVAREERAEALDEARSLIEEEERWQIERDMRDLPPDDLPDRLGQLRGILQSRAEDIREGR